MNLKLVGLGGIAVFAFSMYGSYLYMTYRKAVEASKTLNVPADVSDRYNKTASTYDAEVNIAEKMMRLGKRRRELVQMARGDVLEVSCGTGRNMDYYQLGLRRGVDKKGKAAIQGCRSVTFVDQSSEMVEIAREKFRKLYPDFKMAAFRTQDALKAIEGPPSAPSEAVAQPASSSSGKGADEGGGGDTRDPRQRQQFDTVIQTMGVCSHSDPVSLLAHLGTLTEPKHGRILLLEHGRSYYTWLNNILDNIAPAHADRHGCWWNRDIGDIVRRSGLEVVESKRRHLGTTWQFVLRPGTGKPAENGVSKQGVKDKEKEGDKKPSSTSWLSWTPAK